MLLGMKRIASGANADDATKAAGKNYLSAENADRSIWG